MSGLWLLSVVVALVVGVLIGTQLVDPPPRVGYQPTEERPAGSPPDE